MKRANNEKVDVDSQRDDDASPTFWHFLYVVFNIKVLIGIVINYQGHINDTKENKNMLRLERRSMQIQITNFLCPLHEWNNSNKLCPYTKDDASPQHAPIWCMLRPTWMISALQHKSKYKSNSISNF